MLRITIRRAFRILGVRNTRTANISMLAALIGALGLAILVGSLYPHNRVAVAAPHAVGNEPWIKIVCLQKYVEEGDDFRLRVDKKYDSDWPHESIKVWWYTHPITADETDYERLHQERQYSNGYQSRVGRMGRTFHTLEDNYPEIDETFIVEYLNGVSKGPDGRCKMTITDDDGVGIHKLEITSEPHEIARVKDREGPQVGYTAGDTIEITAHFTGDVTTVNPDTREQSDYAGIYLQVGENRRFAPFLRNYGADALVFGYTVRSDDVDADGISVEDGGIILEGLNFGRATGFYYHRQNRDIGIWPVSEDYDTITRFYHGLDDDRAHKVYQIKVDEPIIDPPTETEIPPVPQPDPEPPPVWVENSVVIDNDIFWTQHGELTKEDGGRDWFSFEANGGEQYIIEVESRMEIAEDYGTPYVDNHLIDPSILEIVNEQGEQVMAEKDGGGYIYNWARGYFTPELDGTYYIAVGSGAQARGYLGHYTISVRQDDHADDEKPHPDVVMRPGESITARINSDVPPGDTTNPNAWSWGETTADHAVPRWGIESADDKDVFRFEITEAGTYRLEMVDGPTSVGLWAIWYANGGGDYLSYKAPVEVFVDNFTPGTHFFAVGTPYQSSGNAGDYTVSLTKVEEAEEIAQP